MKVTVRTVGALRPSRPLTPHEVAQALQSVVGKVIEVEFDATTTPQQLADRVDSLLGIAPAQTVDEVVMEHNVPLAMNQPLASQNVADGDELMYRFYLRI